MEWTNIRKIRNFELIEEIENRFSLSLPDEYKELIRFNNAGIPSQCEFEANNRHYFLERLISARMSDSPNILEAINWVEQSNYHLILPIALVTGGHLISLCICDSDYSVIFLDYESGKHYALADNLIHFLTTLN